MTDIILDSVLVTKLENAMDDVTLRGPDGRVLGRFIPAARCEPQISEEELTRREQETEDTLTTAEVLAYLEKL